MDPPENSQKFHLLDTSQAQRERRDLKSAHVPISEAEQVEATATTSGAVFMGGKLGSSQNAQRVSSPHNAMSFTASPPSVGDSGRNILEIVHPKSPGRIQSIERELI